MKLSECFAFLTLPAVVLVGCGRLLDLDAYKLSSPVDSGVPASAVRMCSRHADCADHAGDGESHPETFCLLAEHRCVSLTSVDCASVSGPEDADNAVLIGSLFTTSGAQGTVNQARERSAQLAIREINAIGGVPDPVAGSAPRPLVLVSCDATSDVLRAADHLANDLHVSAIVGPNGSQDDLDVAMKVTVQAGTLSMSPTAVAQSIAEIQDRDLVWQIVPTDAQRGPLLIHEINAAEKALRAELGRDLRLGVVFRADALGIGTRALLAELQWNGKPLSAPENLNNAVKITGYDASHSDQAEVVSSYLAYAPDLLVLVGTSEAVSAIMAPLEAAWEKPRKPEYLLIDSSKVPQLLGLVGDDPELRFRVRGTGVTPSPRSMSVHDGFLIDYRTTYPDDAQAKSSGVGPSYDVVMAIAMGMAAGKGFTGKDIAAGLRRLGEGEDIELTPARLVGLFGRLSSGQRVTPIGTFSDLVWDDRGAIAAGTLETWCVNVVDGTPGFVSSGLTTDIPGQAFRGVNRVCPVRGGKAPDEPASGTARADQAAPSSPSAMAAAGRAAPAPDAGVPAAAPSGMSMPAMPERPVEASAPPTTPEPVPCIDNACNRAEGEFCCGQGIPESPVPLYTCDVAPRTCAVSLRCTSDKSCPNGQICCIDGQKQSQCRAALSCGSDLHLECESPRQCATGMLCCAKGNDLTGVRSSECRTSCEDSGAAYPYQLCQSQSDCPTLTTCNRVLALPTLGMCY